MSLNAQAKHPIRILTAVPICDGHDSPIITINLELARQGIELIYLGYNCPASAIARAAIQEDVHAIGISSYNGGHLAFFNEGITAPHRHQCCQQGSWSLQDDLRCSGQNIKRE